jgi:hypothetical protein
MQFRRGAGGRSLDRVRCARVRHRAISAAEVTCGQTHPDSSQAAVPSGGRLPWWSLRSPPSSRRRCPPPLCTTGSGRPRTSAVRRRPHGRGRRPVLRGHSGDADEGRDGRPLRGDPRRGRSASGRRADGPAHERG